MNGQDFKVGAYYKVLFAAGWMYFKVTDVRKHALSVVTVEGAEPIVPLYIVAQAWPVSTLEGLIKVGQ